MSQLPQPTVKLHEKLIRLVKGIISAWEEWLREAGESKQ